MKTRVISALIALSLCFAIYFFFETKGLFLICALVTVGCLREYGRLAFSIERTFGMRLWTFHALTLVIYFSALVGDTSGLTALIICAIVFFTTTLMDVKNIDDLSRALRLQSLGLLGFLYVGLMPALATRLLENANGDLWLFCLLVIVFAGDTMAYLVGQKLGKNRLLEAVSPKKSIEGAVGGLIGSGLAGLAMSYVIPQQSPLPMVGIAVVTGIFAQVGDLFESLLKRVAQVKDSGSIMPGHGGILDRCDGVFFAAPVFYVLIRFLTNTLAS
ncbi:MAG: phosphatidate cytidylyltransferase [Bdellovibrionaceae bacterium]|nr:phosphatidate cytidylyltransferase [Pseudobdellovibrionaceae bacterium]